MSACIQFDLFKTREESEVDGLRFEVEKIRASSDKVRKGTYANINELRKDYLDLRSRLEIIERHICKGT
jgi:hypothetical protein